MRGVAHLRHGLWALWLLALSVQADILPGRAQVDSWLKNVGSDNQFDPAKGVDWGILPGPFYTPEQGLGVGVALVGIYRPDSQDQMSQHSTLSLTGFASVTGAFGFGFENYSFFADDQWRFFLNGSLNNMPTYYWGTGFSAGRNNGGKEKYTARELTLQPTLFYHVAADTYLGVGWVFAAKRAGRIKDRGKGTFQQAVGGLSVLNSGASVALTHDTRDFVPNPQYGQIVHLMYTHFSPDLGSDTRFDAIESRYSLYHALSEKNVLAWDLYGRFTQGEVPWNMLSELGNNRRLRGYYEGRYRDRNAVNTQLEYRRKLDWRHGVVAWVGTGTMSDRFAVLGKSSWLPSVGAGYRFEFKPRMNVRLDFGIGKGSTGFYFQVGEAF